MNTVENTCRTGISGYAQPKSPESLTLSELGEEFLSVQTTKVK